MTQHKALLFTLSCLVTSHSLAAANMQGAWQQLLSEHAGTAAESALVDSAQAKIRMAEAQRLPSVTLHSQFNAMNSDIGLWIDTSALIPNSPPVYFPVQEQTFWDTEITATLPIFTGGRIQAGIDASEAGFALQKAQQRQEKNKLFTSFVQRYLSVDLTAQNASIRKLALDNLEQHLQRAIRQYEEGTIAYTERLQSEVERDKATREWRNAEAEHQLAVSAYASLFSADVQLPAEPMTFKSVSLLNASALANRAVQYHPGRQQVLAQKAKAEAGLKAARADFLPTVTLFAQTELAKDDLTQLDPQWTAGVNMQWRLFGQGNRFAATEQYQSLKLAAELKAEQAASDIHILIAQKLTTIDHAHESFQALTSSIELAEENLRLRHSAFEQGLSTSLDEIDAQLLLTGLQLESQKALYDYYVALADLIVLTAQQNDFFQLF